MKQSCRKVAEKRGPKQGTHDRCSWLPPLPWGTRPPHHVEVAPPGGKNIRVFKAPQPASTPAMTKSLETASTTNRGNLQRSRCHNGKFFCVHLVSSACKRCGVPDVQIQRNTKCTSGLMQSQTHNRPISAFCPVVSSRVYMLHVALLPVSVFGLCFVLSCCHVFTCCRVTILLVSVIEPCCKQLRAERRTAGTV